MRETGAVGLMVAESGRALVFALDNLGNNGVSGDRYQFLGLGQWNSKTILGSPKFKKAWFPAPDPEAMERFARRYKAKYGQVPPALAVLGYDAVAIAGQLLADARASGSNEPFSSAALGRPNGFRGAVGPVRFDRGGLGERSMVILEVGEDQFNVIDRGPIAFGSGS